MILVIDNYDSFTWNLVHYLRELGAEVEIARNDEIGVDRAMASRAHGFLLSPGPGRPEDAGLSLALVAAVAAEARRPLFGVCLGHQAIAQHFGGSVVQAPRLMHGKTCLIDHDGTGLFDGLPSPFVATRYHSLTVQPSGLPTSLRMTASADDGTIQALSHSTLPIHGVQFHPESVASQHGHRLCANFLGLAGERPSAKALEDSERRSLA